MKNYRDSDYAANKYADGIVYHFADKTVEVTLADYLRDNPGGTEADFAELKALSDEIYLEQVQSEYRQTYKNVSLTGLVETCACVAPAPEDVLAKRQEESERHQTRLNVASAALDKLTDTQRRRYILHNANGLTTRQIAEREGVSRAAVVYSLQWAEKKIKKYFIAGEK